MGGLGIGIKNLYQGGGGEIRVRLKPDNLGELQMKVITRGRDVGLQIQASDERSKQILEQSLTHLQESLATQKLVLTHVDVSVAPPSGHSDFGSDSKQAAYQNGQNSSLNGGLNQQTNSGGFGRSDNPRDLGAGEVNGSGASAGIRRRPSGFAQPTTSESLQAGRIDVRPDS